MATPPETRFIQGRECWATYDGYRVRYLVLKAQQASTKPPVVFIHGFLGFSFSWRFNLEHFARDRDVYAIDLLGVGHSDRPPRGTVNFSMRAIALRTLQWIADLGLNQVDLVCTSHGGAVGMLMASIDSFDPEPRLQRSLIGRLVLVDPANPYSRTGRKRIWFFKTAIGAWVMKIVGGGQGGVNDFALGRMYGDLKKLTPETRAGYGNMLKTPGTLDYALEVIETWTKDMEQVRAAIDTLRDFPTLLLWGERDITVPTLTCELLSRHFNNSKLVIIKGSGHLPYEEDPEDFNREVLGYLDYTAAPSRSTNGNE